MTFSLDTNIFIEAWTKYYQQEFCPSYWERLTELGHEGTIFIAKEVKDEIKRQEDDLYSWIKDRPFLVQEKTWAVQSALREIYAADPSHGYIIGQNHGRSIADPWVIANAIANDAAVVTKERYSHHTSPKRIKIPNICENMEVKWMNDYEFIKEVGLFFECKRTD